MLFLGRTINPCIYFYNFINGWHQINCAIKFFNYNITMFGEFLHNYMNIGMQISYYADIVMFQRPIMLFNMSCETLSCYAECICMHSGMARLP